MLSSKEKLLQLQEEGKHLFHGSPKGDIEVLEPRQGRHVPDLQKPQESIPDGNPAVSATPHADFATFRAIINGVNVPFSHTSGFGFRDNKKEFIVSSKGVLDAVKDKAGFVYVFDKGDFEPYSRDGEASERNMEWRSYKTVKPLEVVKVSASDLPYEEDIKIVGEDN